MLLLSPSGQMALAADGDVDDPTFGAGGPVITDFHNRTATAVQLDPRPRIDAPILAAIRDAPLQIPGCAFAEPGPGSAVLVRLADGSQVTILSTDPAVIVWEDSRIVLKVNDRARSGTLRVRTPAGQSQAIPLDVFSYEWFNIPPTRGTNAAPLSIAVGADGQVWVNQEFHLEFQHLEPLTGVVTGLPIPKPPDPGPFATTIFGDHRTQTSELGEDILVDPRGRVWFTQGGGSLYDGVYPNHSRIVAFDPEAAEVERYHVYNLPGDRNEVIGLAWDEARQRMWVAQGSLEMRPRIASFDPESIPWDNDFDFSESLLHLICEEGEPDDDCYHFYDLPETSLVPAHLAIGREGLVWYTAYWGNRIGVLQPESGQVLEFPLPEPIGEADPVWLVGSGPWQLVEAPEGDIVFGEFFDSTISRFDASRLLDPACRELDADGRNPCIKEILIPEADLKYEQIHSLTYDLQGRLWYTQHGSQDPPTRASLGFVTADFNHILRLPPLALFPGRDASAVNGIAVDPQTGDLYFCEFFRQRIGRLHRIE